ncbi:MAG: hypothetical protein OQL28_15000, partial [Sedimenticola sp.]|nr:hypothetical protein [Sedimenticola sp.]
RAGKRTGLRPDIGQTVNYSASAEGGDDDKNGQTGFHTGRNYLSSLDYRLFQQFHHQAGRHATG